MVTIYLAGAIRDTHAEDIQWREFLISRIEHKHALNVSILNPVGNKTYNPSTREWKMSGIHAGAKEIFAQDLWCVRRADIIIANFNSFKDGYPSIGTVMEVGAAAGIGGKLVYSILDKDSSFGVENTGNFKLHPFLEQSSSAIFPSVDALVDFLVPHLGMLVGTEPRFGGLTV